MRLLHINGNYLFTYLHQNMIRALSKYISDNEIIVPMYDKSRAIVKPDSNVTVSECFNKWDRVIFDYKQLKIFKSIDKLYNIDEFDCIHAYTLFTDGNCAMRLSEKYNKPYVVAVRNTDVNEFFKKMFYLRKRGVKIMRNASAVFFLSEKYKRQVFDKYVPSKYRKEIEDKTYVIPNGIDDFWINNAYKKDKSDKKNIKIVYAGRIDKNKNIPTTQKAIKILNQRGYNAKLTVVGKVEDKREFKKITSDSNTFYIKALPKEKLSEVYRQNDIFVMPSLTESFGLVYVEAMSQGLPVIYTRGQGFDGQFPDGEVGYAVGDKDVAEIADKIEAVCRNYAEIGQRAVKNVQKFRWDEICKKYIEIYNNIIQKGGKAGKI